MPTAFSVETYGDFFSLWFSFFSLQKYEQELFKLALPCLSAVAGALPPDYMESNYVSMMEKQSSMDSEGNFNPQPVDTSKYGLFYCSSFYCKWCVKSEIKEGTEVNFL